MINFTKPQPNVKREIKKITEWVEDALPESMEDVMVMVNEMQCFEPDCAPLETVVTLLGQQSIVFKIFKPVAEVLPDEAVHGLNVALQKASSGQAIPQHVNRSDENASTTAFGTLQATAMLWTLQQVVHIQLLWLLHGTTLGTPWPLPMEPAG